jgi:hypothetical protein
MNLNTSFKQASGAALSALLFASAVVGQASAADLNTEVEQALEAEMVDDSQFSFTSYFWLTYYAGDMTVNGQTVDMTGLSLLDFLDEGDLRFPPLVGFAEWDQGDWGIYADLTYVGMNFGASNIKLGPGGLLTAGIDLDFSYALANAGLVYNLNEYSGNGFDNELDLLVGGRYTYYDIDLTGTLTPPGIGVSLQETISWFDATAGLRLRGQNEEGYTYSLYGDIGGGSGFSAQTIATVGKTWNMQNFDLNAFVGYRYVYQDYSSGNDAVDLSSHGPIVGARFSF